MTRKNAKTGPRPKTVVLLAKLAMAVVTEGASVRQAAKNLGVSGQWLGKLTTDHEEAWQAAVAAANERAKTFAAKRAALIEAVRTAAYSQAIPADVDAYLSAAKLADCFARADGVELFPANGEMTLTRFYHEWYVPVRLGDPKGNRLSRTTFESTLSRWRYLAGDPPLAKISTVTLAKFRDSLATMRVGKGITRMSPTTVARHVKHVQFLLNKAGPAGPRNRDGQGLLAAVPWVKPPREVVTPPRIVTDDEISACYTAAIGMDRPGGLSYRAADWWRALLVYVWNTGARIGTILAIEWAWVDFERGAVIIPPNATKQRRYQVTPLNATVLDHLRKIRQPSGKVFPWPTTRREAFFVAVHKLQTLASIPEERHFGMHDIRKTVATRLWIVAPEAAVLALGHAASDVTLKHYVEGTRIVRSAFDRLEQPAAFATRG